jgi:dihydrofolate synthase/folylpolyglutamate synthase
MKKIHVTGTNGKGSVCMMTTQILIEQGLLVGTFISPYLVKFNERIKLNGKDIDDSELLTSINEVYELNQTYNKKSGQTLSFFELLTLTSLIYFVKSKVDVIVMEVGIGGLLDATNILNYDVSVITSIGMDHMKQLGNTLESIARNKLGILKQNGQLFTSVDPTLHDLFSEYARDKHASLAFIKPDMIETISEQPHIMKYKGNLYKLSLLGNFQKTNAALAIETVRHLYPSIDESSILLGLAKTYYPGRLETVLDGVIIDGAHNPHAIEKVIFSLKSLFKVYNIHVLFSALSDKEPEIMLRQLETIAKSITLTAFPDPRYKNLDFLPYNFEIDPIRALKNLIENKKENDVIFITGSLHFIGYIKKEVIPYLK